MQRPDRISFNVRPLCAGKCIDLTDCDVVAVLIGDHIAPSVYASGRALKVGEDGVRVRLTARQTKALPRGASPVRLMARRRGTTLIADMEPLMVGA